jgi:RimJ/RimL family protein N-acetyltransferase
VAVSAELARPGPPKPPGYEATEVIWRGLALAQASGEACGVRLCVETDNLRARAVYERVGMLPCRYGMDEQLFFTPSS